MDDIEKALIEVRTTLDVIKKDISSLSDKTTNIDHCIRGNGVPGLRTSHERLSGKVDSLAVALRWSIGVITTVGLSALIWLLQRT